MDVTIVTPLVTWLTEMLGGTNGIAPRFRQDFALVAVPFGSRLRPVVGLQLGEHGDDSGDFIFNSPWRTRPVFRRMNT
jgi:hypothetical protein